MSIARSVLLKLSSGCLKTVFIMRIFYCFLLMFFAVACGGTGQQSQLNALGKEEVRYAAVTDRAGRGMLFEMDEKSGPMMFSALPYTPHELENAKHPYELPQVHYTVVRAALGQMGIAGDDSWMTWTHPEYLLDVKKKMEFSFSFRGI